MRTESVNAESIAGDPGSGTVLYRPRLPARRAEVSKLVFPVVGEILTGATYRGRVRVPTPLHVRARSRRLLWFGNSACMASPRSGVAKEVEPGVHSRFAAVSSGARCA